MPKLRIEEAGGIIEKPVDSAGRVAIPTDFVEEFRDSKLHVMLWLYPCLRIVNEFGRARVLAQLDQYMEEFARADWLKRRVHASMRLVSMDDNNRVRIPQAYWRAIGLPEDSRKVLVMRYDEGILELWTPRNYEEIVLGIDLAGPYWEDAVAALTMKPTVMRKIATFKRALAGGDVEEEEQGEADEDAEEPEGSDE